MTLCGSPVCTGRQLLPAGAGSLENAVLSTCVTPLDTVVPIPVNVGGPADQRDGGHAGHHHPQRALDGPGGALADQPLPGQPDRAEDDHRRQVREVDRVAQRGDQPVDRVLQPGQDVVARRRLVDRDRHPVHRFRRVEDHPGHVVADQRRHVRALQAVRGPELAGDPVVVVQRLPARRRGRRLDHRVDTAGGLLGLRQRRLADVVQARRRSRSSPASTARPGRRCHRCPAPGRPRPVRTG